MAARRKLDDQDKVEQAIRTLLEAIVERDYELPAPWRKQLVEMLVEVDGVTVERVTEGLVAVMIEEFAQSLADEDDLDALADEEKPAGKRGRARR